MKELTLEVLNNMFTNEILGHLIETNIFSLAEEFSEDYSGGRWGWDSVDGHKVLVAPDTSNKTAYNVSVEGNYYQGKMYPKTFGAFITLTLLNRLAWYMHSKGNHGQSEIISDKYYAVRNAVLDNQDIFDVEAILCAMD